MSAPDASGHAAAAPVADPGGAPAGIARLTDALSADLQALPAGAILAVAVSGGPDSVALAAVAAPLARRAGHPLHLLHVHHGLSAHADAWADSVTLLARALGVTAHIARVQVDTATGDGLEAAARDARYTALAGLARKLGVTDVLLAHHLDDQAETVMIRLLRGAGPMGMVAMARVRERDGIRYRRPWLDVERALILPVAAERAAALGVTLADDPSNLDPRHSRGTLRGAVLPAVAAHWPGYRQTLARFARLSADAADIVDEVARADVAPLTQHHPRLGVTLDVAGWRHLTPARRASALRRWLADARAAMPSEARLAELVRQLERRGTDRRVLLRHGALELRLYRDQLCLVSQGGDPDALVIPDDVMLTWTGQASLAVPALGGILHLRPGAPDEPGADPAWLAAAPLRLGLRRGRERLRPGPGRPSRSLKNLYQEAGIPAWERARLPLVWRSGVLAFAAGLGLDARVPVVPGGIHLHWQADAPGATQGLGHDKGPRNA